MSGGFKFLKGLVVGGRESLSLGRVAFWLCFVLALVKWSQDRDITSSHEAVLMWVLAYCLGGKLVNNWRGQTRDEGGK
jgi:hypothetical protein